MPDKLYISKITLPAAAVGQDPVTYEFMDAEARQTLAGGIQFVVCWNGGEPVVENIPAGVVVEYGGQTYTGTKAASTAAALTFYLVKTSSVPGAAGDYYDEYVAAGSPKAWEKIGNTQFDFSNLGDLAFKDAVDLDKGTGHNVLGASTVLGMAAASNVTLKSGASHSDDEVLGANTVISAQDSAVTVTGSEFSKVLGTGTTFKAAASDVEFSDDPTTDAALGANAAFTTSVASSNKYLAATATGMAIASDGNDVEVLTSIGTNTTDAFYNKADGLKKKFVTTEIYGTDGSESVSAVSDIDTEYMELASVPHVSSVGAADTWAFTYDSTNNKLIIGGANGSALELANSNDTVATGALQASDTGAGSSIVSSMTIDSVSAAKKAASATTVATGALLASDAEGYASESGAEVLYSLDTDSANAVTALGTQNKSDILTGVTVTNPSISLAMEDESAAGRVSVGQQISAANISTTVATADAANAITALASATAKAQTISIDSKDEVDVLTTLGTAEAAAQTLSAADDMVDAITALGQMEAAAQTVEVKTADVVKVAEYDDLGISYVNHTV